MKSVAEWAVGHSYQVETMEDVDALPPLDEAYIVTQTTFSAVLADRLVEALGKKVKTFTSTNPFVTQPCSGSRRLVSWRIE